MGAAVVKVIQVDPECRLVGATCSPGGVHLGSDLGEVIGTGAMGIRLEAAPAAALVGADVAIDASLAQATITNVHACVAAAVPILVASTGHDEATLAAVEAATTEIAVLTAPNMSVGITVLLELAQIAAGALSEDYDAEIYEAHHRHKRDAPSGTALAIGKAVASTRGLNLADAAVYDRAGTHGERGTRQIGFSVARAGDIVGEHVLTFAGPGERVEIAHRASDRAAFARGGLRAAKWLVGQLPGRYAMRDVLGL
jgi:4-hydroxy-tetrahydrodipicolinate reductase